MTSGSKHQQQNNKKVVTVTILSGFLGSGKTTLLQHILTSTEHKLKIAVIVNDMAELNVDAQTINRSESSSSMVKHTKREVIALENGCICCTLRGDLIREIHRIQEMGSFDYIIIESTGIAEPQQVAESFCVDPETLALATNNNTATTVSENGGTDEEHMGEMVKMLNEYARLDTCVTVVDAVNFPQYMNSLKRFKELFKDGVEDDNDEEAQKSIAELMVEQVEFANVVLLNKIDLVSSKQVEQAKRLIRSLNPKALVVTASHGKMNVKDVLNTGLFDMDEAKESPGWLQSLENGVTASEGEADEYGVTSFVYRAEKPFHPGRLNDTFVNKILNHACDWNIDGIQDAADISKRDYMERQYGSILRSKGSIWIAGRDEHEFGWGHTGRIISIDPIAPWHCNIPESKWDCETEEQREAIRSKFVEGNEYGDRRQEIVFIGIDMKQDQIQQDLDACLLADAEMAGHALDLPLGSYHDTLPPLPFECFDVATVFCIVRPRQNHHFFVPSSFQLVLSNLTLLLNDEQAYETVRMVRVWIDKCTDTNKDGVLLATLRPEVYEQHSLALAFLHSDAEGSKQSEFRLRIEVVPMKRGQKRKHDEDFTATVMDESSVQVHVVGNVQWVPFQAKDDEEDDASMDKDSDDHCEGEECEILNM